MDVDNISSSLVTHIVLLGSVTGLNWMPLFALPTIITHGDQISLCHLLLY